MANRLFGLAALAVVTFGGLEAACSRGEAEAQEGGEYVYHENGRTTAYLIEPLGDGRELRRLRVWDADGRLLEDRESLEPPLPWTGLEHYRTRTPLRLPLGPPSRGEWYVRWGGRSGFENYHAVEGLPQTRFAYDFVVMRRGWSYAGSGRSNADYYCWGQPVLAPAGGMVAEAEDGRPDNPPGPPRSGARGNQVVIDHGNGERSVFDHLRRGSVAVRRGQWVRAGELIGRCGNSGYSRQPHVHYQLEAFDRGRRIPLPAQFVGYLSDGRYVGRGEPRRGEYVSNG